MFNKYVEHWFNLKKNAQNTVDRTMAKFNLNGLVGRFGLKLVGTKTEILSGRELDLIQAAYTITMDKQITEHTHLVVYETDIKEKLTKAFGLDHIKVLNFEKSLDESNTRFNDVNVCIPAAVNADARICMNRVKLKL